MLLSKISRILITGMLVTSSVNSSVEKGKPYYTDNSSKMLATFQHLGISRFNISFHTIAPPLDL